MAHGCICDNCGAYTSDSFGNEEYALLCEGCYAELGDSDEPRGNPYDDEGDRLFAATARGEECAESWPSAWKANAQAADARRAGPA